MIAYKKRRELLINVMRENFFKDTDDNNISQLSNKINFFKSYKKK